MDAFVVVDLAEDADGQVDDMSDLVSVASSYGTYKTLQAAQAGAETEFNDKSKYEIWKLSAERVGP